MTTVRTIGSIALALVVSGCSFGGGSSEPDALTVIEGDPSAVRTPIIGASKRQERVLREILAGAGATSISRITVKRAGKEFRPHRADAVGVAFRYRNDFEGYWQARIVGQAFTDRSRQEGLPQVVYVATKDEASRVSPSPIAPAPPLSSDERTQLAQSIEDAATRAGADLSSFAVLRPYGTAIAISVRVSDPARFLAHRDHILQEAAVPLTRGSRAG